MSNTVEPAGDNIKKEQPEEIRIEVIKHEDTEEILTMLKKYFYKVSVMYKSKKNPTIQI